MTNCTTINSMLSGVISRMEAINRMTLTLRRMAELIEAAADVSTLFPYVDQLVPLSSLSVESYENLRASCPFLNLPDARQGLEQMRSDLASAYSQLLASLNNHPYGRLTRLVDQLNAKIGQAGIDYGCVVQMLSCARAMCEASGQAAAMLDHNAVVIETYGKTVGDTTTAVLSERAQAKVSELSAVREQLQSLSTL